MCPLYGDYPLFGVSIIRGSTVYTVKSMVQYIPECARGIETVYWEEFVAHLQSDKK